jgi:hypothetical protein
MNYPDLLHPRSGCGFRVGGHGEVQRTQKKSWNSAIALFKSTIIVSANKQFNFRTIDALKFQEKLSSLG